MPDPWVPEEVTRESGRVIIPDDLVDAVLRIAVYYERNDRRFQLVGCGVAPVADVAGMSEVIVKGGAGTARALMRMIRDKIDEEYAARGGE